MSKTLSADGSDHIKMDFNVKGKAHTFHIHKNRFEKTVDGIDKMVRLGRHDVDSIYNRHKDRLKGKPTTAKATKAEIVKNIVKNAGAAEFNKKAHIQHMMNEYPSLSTSQLSKTAASSSGGRMTVANSYYLINKARGPAKASRGVNIG